MKKSIKNNNQPFQTVCIIGCVHGDETIGLKVIKKIKKLKVKKGKIVTLIGNPKALNAGKRFIKEDLNRVFPGKAKGNYEERLAFKLKNKISKYDLVLDIHATTTDVESLAIITSKNKQIIKTIAALNPKRVAIMKPSIGRRALISHCKSGVSLEYGKNNKNEVLTSLINDISNVLFSLGMIYSDAKRKENKTKYYKITGIIKKEGKYKCEKGIKNFKIVKKGQVIANNKNKKILANKDFYPILFGEKAYKNILGFTANLIEHI